MKSQLSFGTSGVRGLVTDLTDEACIRFTRAFIRHYKTLPGAHALECVIAGDLRESTPRIKNAVITGLTAEGFKVLDAGIIPTPAMAYACVVKKAPGIVVTGSHIPSDRNGLKFYFPEGEILKKDEAPILAFEKALQSEPAAAAGEPRLETLDAETLYLSRYTNYFGKDLLRGKSILFYEHSSVARDLVPRILEGLGAQVTRFGRSSEFIPVDTEALENVQNLRKELSKHSDSVLISTDGDGDRPLVLDEKGQVVRGDQLGILGALALRADSVTTPLSSSTALEKTGRFGEIRRCKIGSPFVIEGMEAALAEGRKIVVGFEANGGFLLGSDLHGASGQVLQALPTRDALLPVILALQAALAQKLTLHSLVATLPARYVYSDLIKDFALERSRKILTQLLAQPALLNQKWSSAFGDYTSINTTDGVRVTFADETILHFRPSGNAPEFRIYAEAASDEAALAHGLAAKAWVLGL